MTIGQQSRSSLRRALQRSFYEGTEAMLNLTHRRGSFQTRFAASWKWMLTIACIKSQGLSDDATASEIRRQSKEIGIHPSLSKPFQKHQQLFSVAGIETMPDKALITGLQAISDLSILNRIEKKLRNSIGPPWDHILPEDIGSCYELIREVGPSFEGEKIVLNQVRGRRGSGIHHTPHDATDFMGKEAIRLYDCSVNSEVNDLVVCDLAVGAGAFILQISRIVSERNGLEISDFLRDNAVGFDIDHEVLLVAGLCFHLQAGCPQSVTEYNLHCLDSLGKKATERVIEKIAELPKSDNGNPDITIGNPPYVRAIAKEWKGSGFESENSRNLSSYFMEQACRITKHSGVVSQIVPLSLAQSKNTQSTRRMLENNCSDIEIRAFDCVPGYMFDQGKIGSNSNNSITQRVVIFNCKIGIPNPLKITTSRLIRWGSDERNRLFRNTKTTILPSYLRDECGYPLLGDRRMKKAFSHALSTKRLLSEILSDSGKMSLFVPKAIRYFATASRIDLEREQEVLNFVDRKNRDLAQVMINSSFFYWHWRIIGNGFQISSRDLSSLPLPLMEVAEMMGPEIRKMAERLHRSRDRLAVIKSNRGEIRNIKYDLDQGIMQQLDDLVHRMFRFPEHYPFQASKSNNLADYETLWR